MYDEQASLKVTAEYFDIFGTVKFKDGTEQDLNDVLKNYYHGGDIKVMIYHYWFANDEAIVKYLATEKPNFTEIAKNGFILLLKRLKCQIANVEKIRCTSYEIMFHIEREDTPIVSCDINL